ncbi:MAG: glycosyltransferase family 4 protein [Patescibacteria group bacterium]
MRKIFIPFANAGQIGGPTTFMANLRTYLDRHDFLYATHPWRANGIFFPIAYRLSAIKWIKLIGGKVIQRLDGIYYPSQHGDEYLVMNKPILDIYQQHVDVVIFQSDYSRRQCFAMMGEKKESEYSIIYNGADKNIFYPADGVENIKGKIRFAMAGSFRKKAMIEPVVLALDELKKEFDFELVVMGPIINPEIENFFQRDYVRLAGSKGSKEVAEILRSSHIFIHSQLNDNCPNAVIEALSCGLPVVGFDGGAMSELLFFGKDLLAYVSNDIFQKYEDYDYRKLKDKLRLAVENYDQFKKAALENWRQYDFEECGRKYVEVFNRVIGK